jgi:vacuolar-type H+-ATPase subunit B/Vma2
MELGWKLLSTLPQSELTRLSDAQITRYLQAEHTSHAE